MTYIRPSKPYISDSGSTPDPKFSKKEKDNPPVVQTFAAPVDSQKKLKLREKHARPELEKKAENLSKNIFYRAAQAVAGGAVWCGNGLAWGGLKAAENVAFLGAGLDDTRSESLEELQQFTGSDEFGLVLLSASPVIAAAIAKGMDEGATRDFLNAEKGYITQVVSAMLPKIVVNIAHQAEASDKKPSSAADIISYVLGVIGDHFTGIETEWAKSEAIADSKEREKVQKELMKPLVDKLFDMALPNGSNDLPIARWIGVPLLAYLRRRSLPSKLVKFRKEFSNPHLLNKKEQLAATSNGDVLLQIGKVGSEEVPKWAQGALKSQSSTLAAKIGSKIFTGGSKEKEIELKDIPSDVRMKITEHIELGGEKASPETIITQWKETRHQLTEWVEDQVKMVGSSQDPAIQQLFSLVGSQVEGVFTHALVSLGTTNGKVPEGDISGAIVSNLGNLLEVFFEESGEEIKARHQELKKLGKNPKKDPEFKEMFRPLSKELQEMAGLLKKEGNPLPSLLKTIVDGVFDESVPELLAANYPYLLMLAGIQHDVLTETSHSSRDKLRAFKGGEKLIDICEKARSGVAKSIPKAILKEGNAEKAAEKIAANLPEEASAFRPLVKEFVLSQIKEMGSAESLESSKILKFLENSVDSILSHVFLSLAEGCPEGQNVNFYIANRVLSDIDDIYGKNAEAIQKRFQELVKENKDPVKDPEFVAYFTPVVDKLMTLSGLNEGQGAEVSPLFNGVGEMLLHAQGPKVLASMYRDLLSPQFSRADYEKRLKSFIDAQYSPEKSEEVAFQLQAVCHIVGEKTSKIVKKYLEKYKEQIPALGRPSIQEMWSDNAQSVVDNLVLKMIVNYAETIDPEITAKPGEAQAALLPANIVAKIIKKCESQLPGLQAKVEEAQKIPEKKARKEALNEIFKPMAKELMQLTTLNPKEDLPLFKPLREVAWDAIQDDILPDLLADMYVDTTTWQTHMEEYRNKIQAMTKTTYIPEGCRVLATWIAEIMPPSLVADSDEIAEMVTKMAKKNLEKDNPNNVSVEEYLRVHEDEIKKLIINNIYGIAQGPDAPLNAVKPAIKNYMEAALLNAFASLTEHVHSIEDPTSPKYRDDFLLTTGMEILREATDYLQEINAVTEKAGKSAAYKVDNETMLLKFGKRLPGEELPGVRLHKGVPVSDKAMAARKQIKESNKILAREQKKLAKLKNPRQIQATRSIIEAESLKLKAAKKVLKEHRLEEFFKPLADRLLHLANIKGPEDLSVPSPAREELWKALHDDIIPEALSKMFDELMNPRTRNKMIIEGSDAMIKAIESSKVTPIQLIYKLEKLDKKIIKWEHDVKNLEFAKAEAQRKGNLKKAGEITSKLDEIDGKLREIKKSQGMTIRNLEKYLTKKPGDKAKHEDKVQSDLNQSCGELLVELMGLLPASLTKSIFKIEKVQNLSAESLGEVFRKTLSEEFTLVKIMDKGLASGIKSLQPGVWEGPPEAAVFQPMRKTKGPDGQTILEPSEINVKKIPTTMEEKEAHRLKKVLKEEATAKEAKKKMVEAGHKVASYSLSKGYEKSIGRIVNFVISPWHWMHEQSNILIEKHLGNKPLRIKQFCDYLFHKILITPLEVLATIILYPLKTAFWGLVDLYIGHKADSVIKSMNMDIHESLLYQLTEVLVTALEKKDTNEAQDLIQNYLHKRASTTEVPKSQATHTLRAAQNG